MTSQINNYAEMISEKIKTLPLENQQEVLDFVDFLIEKTQKKSQLKRTQNLAQGKIWMSDDFNEPLSDSFWLGIDKYLPQLKKEIEAILK